MGIDARNVAALYNHADGQRSLSLVGGPVCGSSRPAMSPICDFHRWTRDSNAARAKN